MSASPEAVNKESQYIEDVKLAHERASAEDECRTEAALARVAQRAVEMTHTDEGIRAISDQLHSYVDRGNTHDRAIAHKIEEANMLSAEVGPEAAENLAAGYGKVARINDKRAETAGNMVELEHRLRQKSE